MVAKRTLVTTALESTWPEKSPILFLGSWCCSFSRKEYISSLNFDIAHYHWDDRNKLAKDYKNLELIYEFYLEYFSKKLNKIHNQSYSRRYWRILIGPWLYTCIQVLYDRWYMLYSTINKSESFNIFSLDKEFSDLICDDLDAFNASIEKDEWNEVLYSMIVKNFFSKQVTIKTITQKKPTTQKINFKRDKTKFTNKGKNLKSLIKLFLNTLSSFFVRRSDVFIIAPHMSYYKQFLLNIKLRQFPALWFRKSKKIDCDQKPILRNNIKTSSPGIYEDFEDVLDFMLFKLIPKSYLEGFNVLKKLTKSQGWPKSPRYIFTSNAYSSDEIFKCWAGEKVENGSKLIIGQHGGNFGMTPMATHEAHQIKISDKWLSWGWNDTSEDKIISVGNFKSKIKKSNKRSDGNALLVSMTLPKYSYYLYSVPIAGQVASYFEDQLSFADALPEYIKKKLTIRTYPQDREWDQIARWQNRFGNISFDNSNNSLIKSLASSRIFIGTYNATTYIETFSVNMPTILFWNPNHWEINTNSMDYFSKLVDVNILHYSPESAAAHLENIWTEIDDWWFSDDVQKVVNDFTYRYSKENRNIVDSIASQLKLN